VSNTCCVCVVAGSARRLDRQTPAGGCRLGNAVRQAAAARRHDRYGLSARRRSVPLPAESIRRRAALDLVASATGEVNW
jgi:hypothetical protein